MSLASQIATHALAEQGSVGLRSEDSELSRMITETFVSNPLAEPRGLRRERQVSMDFGRGQVALPRLDQRMLEDMSEPHMPTIHENARVDPLTVDDPWARGHNTSHAACMSLDEDLSRSQTRQFHGNERRGFGSGFPFLCLLIHTTFTPQGMIQ
eukprot:1328041-Amphidinium_carterae.1